MPSGYVAGVGRGAAGFTTRSDIGPGQAPIGGDDKVRDGARGTARRARATVGERTNVEDAGSGRESRAMRSRGEVTDETRDLDASVG